MAALAAAAVTLPVALVAVSGPALADDEPAPAPVGVSARTRVDAEIYARDPAVRGEPTFVSDTVEGVDGVAASAHRWSTTLPDGGTSFSCAASGCAGYDGRAMAAVDEAAGVLRAGAVADMYVGNAPSDNYGIAAYIFATGHAVVEDTITLSAPATVLVTGRLDGVLSSSNSDSDNQGNDPEGVVIATAQFLGERVENGEFRGRPVLGGLDQRHMAGLGIPAAVDESFSIPVDLPAGTTAFRAELLADLDYQTYGYGDRLVRKSARLDFSDSLHFAVEVPAGVTATSGSGLLPLTGGTSEEEPPLDTVAPTVTAEDRTVEATGPGGAAVPFSLVVSDDSDLDPSIACEPASGATFPLGTTPVSCTATDDAGNSGSATFDVTVVDTTPPVLALPADFTVDVFDPKGLSANFLASAADLADPAPVVACTPPSGTLPPPGRTTARCTATDAAGNVSAGSFVMTMLDARQTVALLRDRVTAANLTQTVKAPLLRSLDAADRALAKNDWGGARRALDRAAADLRRSSLPQPQMRGWLGMIERAVIVLRHELTPIIVTAAQRLVNVLSSAGPVPLVSQFLQRLFGGPVTDTQLNAMIKSLRDLGKEMTPKSGIGQQLTPEQRAEARRLVDELVDALSDAKGALG